jgi:MoxR-like ATPase
MTTPNMNQPQPSGTLSRQDSPAAFIPPPISRIEDTGIPALWLQDLILKIMYFQGYMSGFKIAEEVALPFTGVVDILMETLKREKLVEVRSSQVGLGEGAYLFAITGAGIGRAREALDRSQYAGPAPVQLQYYIEASRKQTRRKIQVTHAMLQEGFASLVLSERIIGQLGPAINSNTSIFLYGPPGNGKTSIAKLIGEMLFNQSIYIPFSIYVDGQVIKLYDAVNHRLASREEVTPAGTGTLRAGMRRDPRWVYIQRPFIMTGGELTLDGLDLVFDDTLKFYEAPFQVKANGGILLIDDFGRQQVKPRDLLNRWIVPLENRIDYLNLHTGRKLEVPFDVLVIFSTNLPPKDLVDEAFLRRLRHKIEVRNPSYEEYREIFKRMSNTKSVKYTDSGLAYLLQEWYIKRKRNLRASHPRDLCDQIIDYARYTNQEPALIKELIDQAAESYFVEV